MNDEERIPPPDTIHVHEGSAQIEGMPSWIEPTVPEAEPIDVEATPVDEPSARRSGVSFKANMTMRVKRVGPDGREISSTTADPQAVGRFLVAGALFAALVIAAVVALIVLVAK